MLQFYDGLGGLHVRAKKYNNYLDSNSTTKYQLAHACSTIEEKNLALMLLRLYEDILMDNDNQR